MGSPPVSSGSLATVLPSALTVPALTGGEWVAPSARGRGRSWRSRRPERRRVERRRALVAEIDVDRGAAEGERELRVVLTAAVLESGTRDVRGLVDGDPAFGVRRP